MEMQIGRLAVNSLTLNVAKIQRLLPSTDPALQPIAPTFPFGSAAIFELFGIMFFLKQGTHCHLVPFPQRRSPPSSPWCSPAVGLSIA